MKAKKQATAPTPTEPQGHPQVHVSRGWRVVVHIWLAIHLTALIAAPLVFATMGAPLPRLLYRLTRPYTDLCFLDHGYAFFAPEVGANHLVEYRAWMPGETEPQIGRFPNLEQEWPRLLYHRHFMLSEHLNRVHAPADLPEEFFPDQQEYRQWQAQRAMFASLRESYAAHLRQEYQADRVELVRIEHRQPNALEFESGTPLDASQLYRELPDILRPPAPPGPDTNTAPRFPFPYAPENVPIREVAP
jgi:hypothetical protein